MKKLVTTLFTLVLLFSFSSCGNKENVEYYITKRYVQQPTGDINLTEYTYDDQWNILNSTILLNGKFASAITYTYSEDYTVVVMETTSAIYDPTTQEIHRNFNAEGKVIHAEAYSGGALLSTAEYFYDEAGREIKSVNTSADGQINTLEHLFDDQGNLITYKIDTGYYVSRQEYAYDRQNRRISAEYYQNDQLTSRTEYTYENGVQKGIYYDASGNQLRTTFTTFDDAGNPLTEESFDILGTLQSRTCYAYIGTNGSISSGIPE